jgi:hypothetical protein
MVPKQKTSHIVVRDVVEKEERRWMNMDSLAVITKWIVAFLVIFLLCMLFVFHFIKKRFEERFEVRRVY